MSRSDSTLVVEHDLDDDGLADLRTPRDDVVAEQPLGDGRYGLSHGPFSHYERTLEVTPSPGLANRHRVTERFTWRLAIPVWYLLFAWPMRRALRRRTTGLSIRLGPVCISAGRPRTRQPHGQRCC